MIHCSSLAKYDNGLGRDSEKRQVIGVNGVDVRGHGTAYVELQLTGPAFSPVVVTFLPGPDSRAYYQDVYRKV